MYKRQVENTAMMNHNLELIEDNRRLMAENAELRRELKAAAVGYKDRVEVLVRRKR